MRSQGCAIKLIIKTINGCTSDSRAWAAKLNIDSPGFLFLSLKLDTMVPVDVKSCMAYAKTNWQIFSRVRERQGRLQSRTTRLFIFIDRTPRSMIWVDWDQVMAHKNLSGYFWWKSHQSCVVCFLFFGKTNKDGHKKDVDHYLKVVNRKQNFIEFFKPLWKVLSSVEFVWVISEDCFLYCV